jgi:hypothetical protein
MIGLHITRSGMKNGGCLSFMSGQNRSSIFAFIENLIHESVAVVVAAPHPRRLADLKLLIDAPFVNARDLFAVILCGLPRVIPDGGLRVPKAGGGRQALTPRRPHARLFGVCFDEVMLQPKAL